jgi:hypothetical protein
VRGTRDAMRHLAGCGRRASEQDGGHNRHRNAVG